MIAAGCDAGTLNTKAVIIDGQSILGSAIVPTKAAIEKAATQAMDLAREMAGVRSGDMARCVGTGWGRKKISFADRTSGVVPCLAKGVRWLDQNIRTILDVGGQTIHLIVLNDQGKVQDHAANDKCAAGTGKFLEIMADALSADIDDLGRLSLEAKKKIAISNQCVVFAESEVVNLVNRGEDPADILGSIHQSVVNNLVTMVNRAGLVGKLCVIGGVAKNPGVTVRLADALETEVLKLPEDPQIIGALGAALIAEEEKKNE